MARQEGETAYTTHGQQDSLWDYLTTTRVNALNLKCTTLPMLSLRTQYSRNFHLSWLSFWVAFLSWFAFSPLIPEAVKADLKLTKEQIGNSNIVSLSATLGVRLIVGPLVDRYGPRKVMTSLLVVGAIPSGLAGTVTTARGLYIVRFFIGILGGTFVPCQAWTTIFFDKSVVGRANALVGGFGNSGGGFTFIIMLTLYNRLVSDGLSHHTSWRAAFAIVPVPILLATALLVMVFGTDHPAGKWADRHKTQAAHMVPPNSSNVDAHNVLGDGQKEKTTSGSPSDEKTRTGTVRSVAKPQTDREPSIPPARDPYFSQLDVAVNEPLTFKMTAHMLSAPQTWLPAIAYLTTFGYELAVDANLANILYTMYKSPSFGQTKAGYIASIYGILNVFTRPLGGYLGDVVYVHWGVPGKKYLTVACGLLQGILSLALGLYLDAHPSDPSLGVFVGVFVVLAIFNEAANGANFSLVPHLNPNSNGLMSGIVGAFGNVGGIIFALVYRFAPSPTGRAWWISGVIVIALNLLISLIRVPKW